MTELTEDKLIERGVAAQRLLSDQTYMSFFLETKKNILECIANTQPHEAAKRENLYFQFNGLSDVLGTMQSYVDAAERAIQKRNEQTETFD